MAKRKSQRKADYSKLCVHCTYCVQSGKLPMCHRPRDLVTGQTRPEYCSIERARGSCGPEGTGFQARPLQQKLPLTAA